MNQIASVFSTTSWLLLLLLFVASLLVAIYDHKKLSSELVKANKAKKSGIKLRRILVWSVPIISLLLTVTAKFASLELQREVETVSHKTSPRFVSAEQQKILLDVLKPASSDPVLVWWSPSKTKEHQKYAEDIADILLKAGFNVECRDRPNRFFAEGEEGILVFYSDRGPVGENVRRLRSGLEAAGIDATYQKVPEFEKGETDFQIVVLARVVK
jgi:hypothetical protein